MSIDEKVKYDSFEESVIAAINQAVTATICQDTDPKEKYKALIVELSVLVPQVVGVKIHDGHNLRRTMASISGNQIVSEFLRNFSFYLEKVFAIGYKDFITDIVMKSHLGSSYREAPPNILPREQLELLEPSSDFSGLYQTVPMVRALYWFSNVVESTSFGLSVFRIEIEKPKKT